LRRLLLLPFLGEARKGSSRRSTTGQQSHINDKSTNKTKPQQSKNSMPPAHIPCGSQAYVLEETHGICAVALPVFRYHTAQ
jgi:hypothetical protein